MRLHQLKLEGFRRIKKGIVYFGDATFLIGPNNTGKSSVLRAIEWLLSAYKRIPEQEYYSEIDPETKETKTIAECIILEAEFRNLPMEAKDWRGFKGRIFSYDIPPGSDETGHSITYRKTFPLGKDAIVELKSLKRTLRPEFAGCKKPADFIVKGANEQNVKELFQDLEKNIPATERILLEALDDIWNISDVEEWFTNPGGIPGNVLTKLPRFLLIPADTSSYQIHERRGVLTDTLNKLFEDVRKNSDNYKQAQSFLDKLAKELDPADDKSEFGKMMHELNNVLASVFPEVKIHAVADLSNPDDSLVPIFNIKMSSNVKTEVQNQGTGIVRSAVFGLLRYRQRWLAKRDKQEDRSLIIGFEEPEIYLHPSAANQMRNSIYELSSKSSQIVATTHSPYIIDLARKPRQVLNRFRCDNSDIDIRAFNVTDEFRTLQGDDQTYVKMLLRMDDHIARAFFTRKVVVVEGDTEQIVFRESINRLPLERQLRIAADFEVIKARGKASIIGLVKYLNALGLELHVVHDRDEGVAGAEVFNGPIMAAIGDPNKVTVLKECIENVMGYEPPANEKPYAAYKNCSGWGNSWNDIPNDLRIALGKVFSGYVP